MSEQAAVKQEQEQAKVEESTVQTPQPKPTGNDKADTLVATFLPMVASFSTQAKVSPTDHLGNIKLAVELAVENLTNPKEKVGDRVTTTAALLTDALASLASTSTDALDALAIKLESMVNLADTLDISDPSALTDALAYWSSIKPKGKSGGTRTGASAKPDLGFTVSVTCQKDKKVISTTGKRDVNSLRWAIKSHAKDNHSTDIAKGSPSFVGITEAIEKVFDGSTISAEGGGYTVSRVGAAEVAA